MSRLSLNSPQVRLSHVSFQQSHRLVLTRLNVCILHYVTQPQPQGTSVPIPLGLWLIHGLGVVKLLTDQTSVLQTYCFFSSRGRKLLSFKHVVVACPQKEILPLVINKVMTIQLEKLTLVKKRSRAVDIIKHCYKRQHLKACSLR